MESFNIAGERVFPRDGSQEARRDLDAAALDRPESDVYP